MSKHGIDKTNQRKNSRVQHDMMVNHRSSEKAKEHFRRPAYQMCGLTKTQGQQMEQCDVLGYLDKRGQDVKEKIE